MPTWGLDTLPSQRVPQKILKKSISLYYIWHYNAGILDKSDLPQVTEGRPKENIALVAEIFHSFKCLILHIIFLQ